VLFGVLFVGVLDTVDPAQRRALLRNLAVGAVLIVAAAADAFYQRLERMPVRVEESHEDLQEAPA
jgi:hypothetical protein